MTANTDQCVKCGLCLPRCPTYRALRDEADSPRGRIALIQGLVDERLADSQRLHRHLGNCLTCRACETHCPSLVRFGEIMDDARALSGLRSKGLPQLLRRLWLRLLTSGTGARACARLGALYRLSGLARLAEGIGLIRWPAAAAFHRLAIQLRQPADIVLAQPAAGASTRPVALFHGCVAQVAQPGAIKAAIAVLGRLGCTVETPKDQACCGAMHRHNGLPEVADGLLATNADAFAGRTVVGIASACIAELRCHERLAQSREICRLLIELDWPADASPRPLPARVAVHEPCSQRNMLADSTAAYELLQRIPSIELLPVPDNDLCCGAAGTYLTQRPRLSRALLQPKLDALAQLAPKILVTTNTGCALHLAAGIREAGLEIEVMHPVELVARQLSPNPNEPAPATRE